MLGAGLAAFGAVVASYVAAQRTHLLGATPSMVDLRVYRDGGRIARQLPPFSPHLASPLYDWAGVFGFLKFTYPPFAALLFSLVAAVPLHLLAAWSVVANMALLVLALWFTVGGLGYRRIATRLGLALLASAAVFWTEPVIRTLFLGQVNLALMALILWDTTSPATGPRRWWRGAGIGVAAGIKMVPLIFIPYLLLTRRFRQAAVATAAFAATVAAGFAALPADSERWWLGGAFLQGGRTGFVGWEGNQSLRGLITRLAGSVAGAAPWWLAVAAVVAMAGLLVAARLHRAGHPVAGALACALTGLLVSPVSWDHHWVWIAPAVALAGHHAARAWRDSARTAATRLWQAAGFAALAAGLAPLYGAWPGSLWGETGNHGTFSLGIIWAPPSTNPSLYPQLGDRPWYPEYHWHGTQLIVGNAYVLGGLGLLLLLAVLARRVGATTRAAAPGAESAVAAPAHENAAR